MMGRMIKNPKVRLGAAALSLVLIALGVWVGLRLAPMAQKAASAVKSCQPVGDAVAPGNLANMVYVPGGTVTLGSDEFYPEEQPLRQVAVEGFWIDKTEVTNRQFAAFVAATGYQTLAERQPKPEDYPDIPPEKLEPGSAVFVAPGEVHGYEDISQWWRFTPGANWRNPEGPGSNIDGLEDEPVIHVAYEDALAYAKWAGRALPSEAQFEWAAQGGLKGQKYAWGNDPKPGGKPGANHWQGIFPLYNENSDGFAGRAPVGCFPANGYGLYDITGNVWEWTTDWYVPAHPDVPASEADSRAVLGQGQRVIKGGSYLCADNFCGRYRPAARQPGDPTFSTTHIGFRTIANAPAPKAP